MRRASLALAALAAAAGCVRAPPPDLSRDPGALLSQVREAQERVRAVRGPARIGVASPRLSGSMEGWLAAEKPDRVRIELLDFFGNPAAILVAAGGRFSLYDPQRAVLYRGAATPENLARLLPIPLGAPELATLLCGSAPLLEGRAAGVEPDGSALRLEVAVAGGGRQILRVGEGAAVEEARLEPPAGEATGGWQASFDVFRRRAGARVPTDAELRAGGSRVTLHWREGLEVNPPADPDAFRLDPPRGARVEELEPGATPPEVGLPLRPGSPR